MGRHKWSWLWCAPLISGQMAAASPVDCPAAGGDFKIFVDELASATGTLLPAKTKALEFSLRSLERSSSPALRVIRCDGRRASQVDFDPTMTDILINRNVLFEVWGTVDKQRVSIDYALVPMLKRSRDGIPRVFYHADGFLDPKVLIEANKMRALLLVGAGVTKADLALATPPGRDRDPQIDAAYSFLCQASALLGKLKGVDDLGAHVGESLKRLRQTALQDPGYDGTVRLSGTRTCGGTS